MSRRTSLDNTYRRINARMQKLYETYGADNPTYQRYASTVENNFNVIIKPDGRVQIREGKTNATMNVHRSDILAELEQYDTRQTLRKEAREYAKQYGLGKSKNIDELVEKQEFVRANRDLITWVSEQIKDGANLTDNLKELYNKAAGRTDELSYDELYDMIKVALPDIELYE